MIEEYYIVRYTHGGARLVEKDELEEFILQHREDIAEILQVLTTRKLKAEINIKIEIE